jgi:hypothetical protein
LFDRLPRQLCRGARGQRLGLQYVVQQRHPGDVAGTLDDLPSQRIIELDEVGWTIKPRDRELVRQARVRAHPGRHDLEHDPGLPRRLDQPLDLVTHHGRAAHRPGEHALVQDDPQQRRLRRSRIACRSIRALTSRSTSASGEAG